MLQSSVVEAARQNIAGCETTQQAQLPVMGDLKQPIIFTGTKLLPSSGERAEPKVLSCAFLKTR